jgi:hypothetical protein
MKAESIDNKVKRFLPGQPFTSKDLAQALRTDREFADKWSQAMNRIEEEKLEESHRKELQAVEQRQKDLQSLDETFQKMKTIAKTANNEIVVIKESQQQQRKKGAAKVNSLKKQIVSERQKKIRSYLEKTPNPQLKGKSLEAHLNDELELHASTRTISNDLRVIRKNA